MFEKMFQLKEHNTNVKTEVIAGLTTFMTMAYIVIVNPAILEAAGIPRGPSMVATILSAFSAPFSWDSMQRDHLRLRHTWEKMPSSPTRS